MNIVIYDCEIKRGIPARGEERIQGIEYCKGWGDHAGMGVSVTGVYDYKEDRYRVFCDDNVDEMLGLFAGADLLVGFNSIRFDDALLTATYADFADVTTERYDLLVEVWRAAGLKPSWGSPKTHGGYGLGDMCQANFGIAKSGHGAMAPVDWQRGKIGSVIDYCLHDVYMTKMLMDCAIAGEDIISPKGGMLSLRTPYSPPNVYRLEDVLDDEGVGADPGYRDGKKSERGAELNLDEHKTEQAAKTFPEKLYAAGVKLKWDDLLIEIEPLDTEDRVLVAVHTNAGLLIKRKLRLHEWTNEELNEALINKDAPTVVAYLQNHEALHKRIGEE